MKLLKAVSKSYAFVAIRAAFGEVAARDFLLVDYRLDRGKPGSSDLKPGDRLSQLMEAA